MAFDLEAPKPIADVPVSPKKEPEVQAAMERIATDIDKWKKLTDAEIFKGVSQLFVSFEPSSIPSYAEMEFYAKSPPLHYNPKNYYERVRERPKTVEELLVEARRLIDEKGWCKNRFYEENPETGEKVSFCMLGSLVEANGTNAHNATQDEATRILAGAISERYGYFLINSPAESLIPSFNDSSVIEKRDVLSVFDRAIDYVRRRYS